MNYVVDELTDKLIETLLDAGGDDDVSKLIVLTAKEERLKDLLINYMQTKMKRGEKVDQQKVLRIAIYFAKNGDKAWKEFESIE